METYTVYKIICLINNKLYIGYTKHTISHRLKTHFRNAKKSSMINNKFSSAILKHGKENFIIETIMSTNDKNTVLEKEKYYIELYDSVKNGYNSSKGGEFGGNGINHADFSGKKNPFYNKKHSEESKIQISLNHAKVTWWGGKTNGSFKKGKEHPRSKQVKIDGIVYESMKIASETLKLPKSKIKKIGEII
jgi:group I intron endonuclease